MGPRSVKIKFLIQQGIVEYGDLDKYISQMIAAYFVGDDGNKFLNAGRTLCQGRRRFIVELMEEKEHCKKIQFYELLRRLIWVDSGAADIILKNVLNNLNN